MNSDTRPRYRRQEVHHAVQDNLLSLMKLIITYETGIIMRCKSPRTWIWREAGVGEGGTGALQHAGGDQEVWGGAGEDYIRDTLTCYPAAERCRLRAIDHCNQY